jgi:hypothetical protein
MTDAGRPGGTRGGAGRLKLRAHDAEDVRALAAVLQDALVPIADMAYLRAEKRFVLVANRFRWERGGAEAPPEPNSALAAEPGSDARFEDAGDEAGPSFERTHCGICFDRVRNVRLRGIDLKDRGRILSLLTLDAGPRHVTLVFSGGGEIRLEVSRIRCHMEDLGEPWPTHWRPAHPEAAPEEVGEPG